uniref:MGAT4 conserved region domain-containing protein n=1 Tax=Meloidogyne incognita TaxID=6306 RepID=A0A914KGX6_MELIC
MVWRTKQNLDYAYAMLHVYNSKPSSKYYVQLEDDIITVPGFVSEMLRFANNNSAKFFMIEFSSLGFIGRMFHNNYDLLKMAHFILLLYNSLPVDWILQNLISAKFCPIDEGWPNCYRKVIVKNIIINLFYKLEKKFCSNKCPNKL